MNYWRCECGKTEYWESGMYPHDCQGCDECNTTLSTIPSGHKELQPHEPELRYNEVTGEPDHQICKVCHERLPLKN